MIREGEEKGNENCKQARGKYELKTGGWGKGKRRKKEATEKEKATIWGTISPLHRLIYDNKYRNVSI